jgi:dimethylaniline monooxygenase (N-oxide forming)
LRCAPRRRLDCVCGNVYVPNGFRVAETQALWTTAYVDGLFNFPIVEDRQKDIAWVNVLQRRRSPAHGTKGNYFHYDMMGYVDGLLALNGLEKHKKGWWGDLVNPFVAADLEVAGTEYVDKYRKVNGA